MFYKEVADKIKNPNFTLIDRRSENLGCFCFEIMWKDVVQAAMPQMTI